LPELRRRRNDLRVRAEVEDNMNRRDRRLLQRQTSHILPPSWDNGVAMIAIVGVFIAGLTTGGLLFAFRDSSSAPTASDEGRTALAFFLNGTANNPGR
jgi:hypothetical protein